MAGLSKANKCFLLSIKFNLLLVFAHFCLVYPTQVHLLLLAGI